MRLDPSPRGFNLPSIFVHFVKMEWNLLTITYFLVWWCWISWQECLASGMCHLTYFFPMMIGCFDLIVPGLGRALKMSFEGVFYVMWWAIWLFHNKMVFGKDQRKKAILFNNIVTQALCLVYDSD